MTYAERVRMLARLGRAKDLRATLERRIDELERRALVAELRLALERRDTAALRARLDRLT